MTVPATALLQRLLARGKFRHVQVVLRLAELGSVQRTAGAIGLTQSSVTQTLAYLEQLLELKLFDRHARGVRPTAACRALLPAMRQLMTGLAQGADLASGSGAKRAQQIRVLSSVSAAHGMLLPALNAFHDHHAQVRVLLGEAEGEDQLLAITRGEVDLVACRRPATLPQGWDFEPLVQDELVVVCGPAHPLARRRGTLRWQDLDGHAWLQGPVGSIARTRLDALSQSLQRLAAPHPFVTRMPAALAGALRQRPVLGFLPRSYLRHLVDAGHLVELALVERFPIEPLGLLAPLEERSDTCALLMDFVRAKTSSAG